MSHHSSTLFFLLVVLLSAATNPLAHGQTTGTRSVTVNLTSRLCCTPTANCPGAPLAGTLVKVNCTTNLFGGSKFVGQSITDANGTLTVRFTLESPNIFPPTCYAYFGVPLDVTICPTLSATRGTVRSPVLFVDNLFLGALLGRDVRARTLGYYVSLPTIS